jgi:hypothetical protein
LEVLANKRAYTGFLDSPRPTALSICPRICRGAENRVPPAQAVWKKGSVTGGGNNLSELKCSGETFRAFNLPYARKLGQYTFTGCAHNEVDAARFRILKETKPMQPEKIQFGLLDSIIDELVDVMLPHYEPDYEIEDCLDKMTGKLRNRYHDAYNKLYSQPSDLADIKRVGVFIKNEDLCKEVDHDGQFTKSARLIMGRDPRFTLAYAMFVDPLEAALKGVEQYASGKDMHEMGELFGDLIHGEWYAKTDFAAFEATKRPWWIWFVEAEVDRRLMKRKGVSKEKIRVFNAFQRHRLETKGYTPHGVKLCFSGNQCSGDRCTKYNNSKSNWILSRYFRRYHGLAPRNFAVMGDDGLHKLPVGFDRYEDTFAHFGFDIKFEIVRDYHDADFCSSKFIQTSPGHFVMVQDLRKLLTKLGSVNKVSHVPYLADYFASLGYMYQVVYSGIPVYEDIGKWMRGAVQGRHFVNLELFANGSYGLLSAFKAVKKQERPRAITELVMAELAMCFDFTQADYDVLIQFFQQPLTLQPEHSKVKKHTPRTIPLLFPLVNPLYLIRTDSDRFPARPGKGDWGE